LSPRITQTIWPIEPHTEAKHAILRKYLAAWLPIMASRGGSINYVDGFAGPGEYMGGEEGSPLIAIRTIIEHRVNLKSKFTLAFIEQDRERYEFLQKKLATITLPENLRVGCYCDQFARVMESALDKFSKEGRRPAPTFVFIDPFGFAGVPLSLIKRIMQNPHCEVLITFMYEELNRFISQERLWNSVAELYGNDDWRSVIDVEDPRRREAVLHGLYKSRLNAGANIQHVLSFKMRNRSNTTDYFLFFGTNNLLGLKKMKEVMWKVDESGSFLFSDNTHNSDQPVLFQREPDFRLLKRLVLERFGRTITTVMELEKYILTQTPFRETHYKRQILLPMEEAGEINAYRPTRIRRKGSFPYDCIIEFL
jgi:three-Cys-motif partner protein